MAAKKGMEKNAKTEKKTSAERGDTVKVSYKGTLDSGDVFDSCDNSKPLEFKIGAEQVLPDFESAVVGMTVGETKKIHIQAKKGYGQYDPGLLRRIPRSAIPEKMEIKKGMLIVLKTKEGMNLNSIVTEVTDDRITIDLNHPLAGKNLNFEIKLVGIEKQEE